MKKIFQSCLLFAFFILAVLCVYPDNSDLHSIVGENSPGNDLSDYSNYDSDAIQRFYRTLDDNNDSPRSSSSSNTRRSAFKPYNRVGYRNKAKEQNLDIIDELLVNLRNLTGLGERATHYSTLKSVVNKLQELKGLIVTETEIISDDGPFTKTGLFDYGEFWMNELKSKVYYMPSTTPSHVVLRRAVNDLEIYYNK